MIEGVLSYNQLLRSYYAENPSIGTDGLVRQFMAPGQQGNFLMDVATTNLISYERRVYQAVARLPANSGRLAGPDSTMLTEYNGELCQAQGNPRIVRHVYRQLDPLFGYRELSVLLGNSLSADELKGVNDAISETTLTMMLDGDFSLFPQVSRSALAQYLPALLDGYRFLTTAMVHGMRSQGLPRQFTPNVVATLGQRVDLLHTQLCA